MALTKSRRIPPQLNETSLHELALRYVGKYATTRAKLRQYLTRKLRERGWDGPREPDLEAMSNRFAELGYIDDAGYALARSRTLSARGYGKRRLADKLRTDGVDEVDAAAAHEHAEQEAVAAALRFAERRRLGPFANSAADPQLRQKWTAAMIRAGHSLALAQAIVRIPQASEIDLESLRRCCGATDR